MPLLDEDLFLLAFLGGMPGSVVSTFAFLFLGLFDSAVVLAIAWETGANKPKYQNNG